MLASSSASRTGRDSILGRLEPGTTYYWRVDSENDDDTTTGSIWKFRTAGSDIPTDPTPAH